MSGTVRRICVVRFGGMGDILLATPAIRALSQHFETTEIDYIVGRGMQDAITGIPYLRNVIVFDKSGEDARLKNFLPFLKKLRAARYDLFVNFHPSAKTFIMALASGARWHLTFRKDRRKQPDTGRVRHAIDDFTKELKPLGIRHVEDRQMDFFVPAEATRRVKELLSENGIHDNDKIVVVNPAATRDVNRWTPEKFVAFFDTFANANPTVRLVLSGGPTDIELSGHIAAATKADVLNIAGKIKVKELGALLARANTVVTGDTGPLHIASAVGAPIVCLSGAADPDRTGPTRPNDLVVINRELPCVSCQDKTCRRHDIACMTQLPVDWVIDAVQKRLRTPTAPREPLLR